jgi:hypothetical protein
VAFSQLFFALSCRSFRHTMPELGPLTNPHLLGAILISGLLQLSVVTLPFAQPVFESATGLGRTWILICILALAPVTLIELAKIGLRLVRRNKSPGKRQDCAYSHRIAGRVGSLFRMTAYECSGESWPKKTPDPLDRT